jgi:VWFA-related protein
MVARIIPHRVAVAALGVVLLAGAAAPAFAQEGEPQGEQGYSAQVVQVDTSQFPQIDLWVSVTDAAGNPVRNVEDSAFTILENGQPVPIGEVYQAGEQGPVTTVLVIDRSGSMNDVGKLDAAKAAATAFVDLMRAEDSTGVIVFNTQVETIQPLTSDKDALRQAIAGIEAFEDTAVYDALASAVDMLGGVQGRRVIILLSDGLDNSSALALDDILARIEQEEISIYTIGLGDPAVGIGSTSGIDEAALQAIADQSRGTYAYSPDAAGLSGLYEQLSRRLQNEYRLRYISPNTLRDGVERGVEVQLTTPSGVTSGASSAVEAGYNPGGLIPETSGAMSWPLFGGLLAGLALLLVVPGVLRRGGTRAAGGAPAKRKKGRVKLTQPAAADSGPAVSAGKQAAARPRVRLRDKGS